MSGHALEPAEEDVAITTQVGTDESQAPSSSNAVPQPVGGTTTHHEAPSVQLDHSEGTGPRPKMDIPFDENIFDSAPPNPDHETDEVQYIEPSTEGLPHPPDFKPFFTLIEHPETGAYHHPEVHYIFSDDDPEILTAAILESLDEARQDDTEPASPPRRSVIVDVAADGKTIASVASLSSEWQALESSVGPAPSWGSDATAAERGLMLRISGQQASGNSLPDGTMRGQREYTSVEDMLETYSRKLARLDSTLRRTAERTQDL